MRRKRKDAVVIPTIKVAGVEYVERTHFDAACFAAVNNLSCVQAIQKERDEWRNKFNALANGRK